MSGAKFQVLAIPTAPVVEWFGADGQRQTANLTPQWYRVITALVARTGGTQGRLTPSEGVDSVLQLFETGYPQEGAVAGQMTFWPEVVQSDSTLGRFPQETGVDTLLGRDFPVEYLRETLGIQWPEVVDAAATLGALPWAGRSVPPASETITVGASPYLFTSLGIGHALVSGGTVSSITWSRDGSTYLATGQTAGFFPLELTDSIIITYTVAPTLTFIRSAV